MQLPKAFAFSVVFLLLGTVGFGDSQRRTELFTVSEGPYDEVMADCGDFLVYEFYSVTFRGVIRFDADGTPVQIVEHLSTYDAVYYNGNDPTIQLEASGEHGLRRWDLVDGFLYMSGPAVRVDAPGGQPVFLHTGHWIWDTTTWELVFQKGRSDLFDNDVAALCRALAPQ